jgi:hypothetical protein
MNQNKLVWQTIFLILLFVHSIQIVIHGTVLTIVAKNVLTQHLECFVMGKHAVVIHNARAIIALIKLALLLHLLKINTQMEQFALLMLNARIITAFQEYVLLATNPRQVNIAVVIDANLTINAFKVDAF